MEKAAFILAYLTSKGRLPFLGLNDVIAGIRRGWPGHRVGWILLQAFYQCHRGTNPSTGWTLTLHLIWFYRKAKCLRPLFSYLHRLLYACIKGVSQQMEWLLELMGHIRNIAYGGKSEASGDTSEVCQ